MPSPPPQFRAPLLWLLLPLMAGLAAAKAWPLPGSGIRLLGPGAALLALAAIAAATANRPRLWSGCVALSAGLGGFLLLHLRYPWLHQENRQPPREVTVSLEVEHLFAQAPGARNYSGLGVIVAAPPQAPELAGRRIYFSAIRRISVPPLTAGRYLARGVVESLPADPAPGGFRDYLANLGVRQQLGRAQLLRMEAPPGWFHRACGLARDRLTRILQLGLERHPETASLYLAMLLGEKAELTPGQQDAFMRSGTYHIFSISGLHVGVIALALQGLLRMLRIPRLAGTLLTLASLWLYVQVTGGSSPALRAFLMIAFTLSAQTFRLPGNAFAALTGSALATLLLDPLQLFSSGFQMSYAVVAGLILMGGPLSDTLLARWQPFALLPASSWRWWHRTIAGGGRKVITAAAGCWAAFLASAPAGIGFFGLFSPGSLLANLIVIPLSSLAIIGGFLSLLAGLLHLPALSALFNAAAALVILGTDRLLQHGTGWPGMFFPARFHQPWLVPAGMLAMTGILMAGASVRWRRRFGGYWPPLGLLVLLVIFGVKFG